MTTYRNQIRHDIIPQPGSGGTRSSATPSFVSPYNRADAASLPVDGLAEDAVLTPQQRRGIADHLVALYGENEMNRVSLLAKSDLYLVIRYNTTIAAEKRQAEIDSSTAARSRIEAKAQAKAEAENGTPRFDGLPNRPGFIVGHAPAAAVPQGRFDAQSNFDAYARGVHDMNAWRTRSDAEDPTAHGGLPQRAQAHHQPQPQGRFDAQTNEDAYTKGIDDMNAWRDA